LGLKKLGFNLCNFFSRKLMGDMKNTVCCLG
jgi:hypothetical protein